MQDDTSYPTDLTDEQWALLEPLLPRRKRRGRKPKYTLRDIVQAVLYLLRAGCAWRLLPKTFPPWSSVYGYFRRWIQNGLWQRIHDTMRRTVRQQDRRQDEPSAGVLDSQSVKLGDQGGVSGYDAGKNIKGRKRHVLVDTMGLIWGLAISGADLQDRDGAVEVLCRLLGSEALGRWQLIWADSAYGGKLEDWVAELPTPQKLRLEIVRRCDDVKGFKLLPKRWVVERTFGWLVKCRRLVRDYEAKVSHSEAMVLLAMIALMVRRLA